MSQLATASTVPQDEDSFAQYPADVWRKYGRESITTIPIPIDVGKGRICTFYAVSNSEGFRGIKIVPDPSTAPKGSTDDCAEKQEVINDIRLNQSFPFSSRLADRIEFLVEAGEAPEEQPLALGSLKYFLRFLESISNLAYPDIMLSTHGNLRVQWTKSRKEHFVAEFLPTGDVRFVVFTQNKKHADKVTRVFGSATTDMLLDAVGNYDVLEWALSD